MVMKIKYSLLLFLAMLITIPEIQAQSTQASLILAPSVFDHGTLTTADFLDRKKKRKKRKFLAPKHNTLAIGLVGGDPLGLGLRGIFRLGVIGVSADLAYNRIRDDQGDKVSAVGLKTDFRIYSKGLIAKLIRPYTFVGITTQRGQFNETKSESVYLIDGGFGAGVKLFRLEIGAEAGILIPARQLTDYRPGLGAFVNASVVMWLF